MKNNCDKDSQLSKQIVQWYLKNGRSNLPWRKNVTAYRVWTGAGNNCNYASLTDRGR